nr:cyclase-like protein 4 [Parasteatoda tepidariorum]
MLKLVILLFLFTSAVYLFPLQKRMVDLSHTYDERANTDPRSLGYMMTIDRKDDSLGRWLQFEVISTGTQQGTHMDAPSHVIKGGFNIDQLPIENFIVRATVVDISARVVSDPDTQFFIDDFMDFEKNTGCSLDDTFVLLRTGWDQRWGSNTDYLGTDDGDLTKLHFPGLDSLAARWLVERRSIKGVGIDTFSIDGSSPYFLSHAILLGENKYVLENLMNIGRIPRCGATLYIMPMKLRGASGAPTRVIASYSEGMEAGWNFKPREMERDHFYTEIWPHWNFSSWGWTKDMFNEEMWPYFNFTSVWSNDTFDEGMWPNWNFTTWGWSKDVFNEEMWPDFNSSFWEWADDDKQTWSN